MLKIKYNVEKENFTEIETSNHNGVKKSKENNRKDT